MQLPNTSENNADNVVTPAAPKPAVDASKFDGTPRPITEVVVLPDFPRSVLGEFIEIGGRAGIVMEIVNQSLKMRMQDGSLQSFNSNVLRKLYAPMQRPEPTPEPERPSYRDTDDSADDDQDNVEESDEAAAPGALVAEAKFEGAAKPISEFVTLPDYPKCLLGVHIDIGGFTGVVIEIADKSLKVKARHGGSQRFNANVLKRVYGPQPKQEERPARPTYRNPAPAPAVEERPRQVITEPDFNAPVKLIAEYITRADFPQCTFGAHVEINGFTGVVIEIVKGSLKVKSHDGLTRSYNAQVLKKLHG